MTRKAASKATTLISTGTMAATIVWAGSQADTGKAKGNGEQYRPAESALSALTIFVIDEAHRKAYVGLNLDAV
jgi:hypothetical protein